ncbi:GNAT family N-acetyltransferase [Vagococcus carniphilus]|uniref:N-acetyltransferase domain-containing protein n=1 Tax=Vagococcus carniphilus TaxID=218144 RepID=A0A430B1K0_9ENTE|nr:GNAT family N-acetyltransferase [Vagococcus carniphilus]QNN74085.1 GNAT family N-acetyltransferase [Vagococcus carniphilus]RSU14131.1 hypothetical protein CBF28_08235 [Vagococcus carniphilus]
MNVRLSKINDFEKLNNIQKEVAERLKEKGSKQWNYILEGVEEPVLMSRIKQNEVIILEDNGEVVGLAYLYQEPIFWDKSLWHDDKQEGIYYLHKVAIGNTAKGKKYGNIFLKEIINWVRIQNGKAIRLDCKADISYLNQFYPSAGFDFVAVRKTGHFKELYSDFNLYSYNIS